MAAVTAFFFISFSRHCTRTANFEADISAVALEQLKERYPELAGGTRIINDNKTTFADGFFGMVVDIEVMEHVDDLQAYIAEIFCLLKPNGNFIWTTPCSNRYSIEHIYSHAMKLLETTDKGCRRWIWEYPAHLRSSEAEAVLVHAGFRQTLLRLRAHLFSFLCTRLRAKNRIPEKLATYFLKLDYTFFKHLPNGASMIGCAIK